VCINAFSFGNSTKYPFVLIANRDEFLNRKSLHASFHGENNSILSGIDSEKSGTWLGITKSGRFAMVTNFRNPHLIKDLKSTRGQLVNDFLSSELSPMEFCQTIKSTWDQFNGFNLIVADLNDLNFWYASNISLETCKLKPGLHGICNALLDTPWPKMNLLKEGLRNVMMEEETLNLDLLQPLLLNKKKFPPTELPNTGVSTAIEELLSSIFISSPAYGTVCSTVILVDFHGKVLFRELVHNHVQSTFVSNDFQFYI